MKLVSLKAKLTVTLIVSLSVTFAVAFWFSTHNTQDIVSDLHRSSGEALKYVLDRQIQTYMANGENEELQPLVEDIVKQGISAELTIINADGIIARSSDISQLEKPTNDPQWKTVFQSKQDYILDTVIDGEPLELLYHTFENHKDCMDCHDAPEGAILGGMKVTTSNAQLTSTLSHNLWMSIIMGAMGSSFLIILLLLLLRSKVFRPLELIRKQLGFAALGITDQEIDINSKDREIQSLQESTEKLINYMKELTGAAESIAANNLTITVEPKSEKDVLGNSFKMMIGNLTGMVRQLGENATQLVSAANEVASSSEQMSRGAKDQTDQVTQVSTAVEEMTATIVESSRNAAEATESARGASDTAGKGGEIVNETIQGMQRIASVVRESAESIGKLAKSADQIGEIIGVIDDIADQTNLLALNAAIEAAR
ncbi:MAG: methyl-accepting chemotaxis protein, partial [candidate division Zixibacteria bacterium]|nr:methyl-accepting chemotaxis protein [candidate division Zixibacteria bacterium]